MNSPRSEAKRAVPDRSRTAASSVPADTCPPVRRSIERTGGAPADRSPRNEGRKPRPDIAEKIAHNVRRAKAADCHTCGAPVLVGLDGDTCAWTATVDAQPLPAGLPGQHAEMAAHLDGRRTYIALHGGELHWRDPSAAARPTTKPLHVEHTCPEETR